jgi:hypothetical protein
MERMEVIKTLVIGLGSSGIEVCDLLMERIRWELGDVKRAPWVEFLGIETNETVETDLREQGDLLLLTLSAQQYSALLSDHKGYEERLRLSEWADYAVLRSLPGNAVKEGAGNIRMVGRLVFLSHYDTISREVSKRLNNLRQLTQAIALDKRGELLNGQNPPLEFVGNIRIFVVGTLCGGTCSGMASDFGFFLRLTALQDERIVGIFTLPPHNLTNAVERKAERYKKNAYAALTELNHYHLVNREGENPIVFPDNRRADFTQTPYDHPYLVFPSGITRSDIDLMHRTIADRIFLNIFAPRTDSFRRTVDAPQISEDDIRGDRYGRAHVFLSMGIATIEYPAERIIAACTARQLAYTLRQWNSRTLNDGEIATRVSEIGLEWETIKGWILKTNTGESLDGVVRSKAEEIVNLSTTSVEKARESLHKLRNAFTNQGLISLTQFEELSRGSIISACLSNKNYARKEFVSRLRALIQRDLLDYRVGPAALRDVMRSAKHQLEQIISQPEPDISTAIQRVNNLLDKMEQCTRSRKLKLAGLRAKEKRRLRNELKNALNDEIQQRVKIAVHIALRDLPSEHRELQSGLASMIRMELDTVYRRLDNLVSRIAEQRDKLDKEDHDLSYDEPTVSGKVLFVSGLSGTVSAEYRLSLESEQQGVSWEQQRERLAYELVRNWGSLVERVIPPGNIQPQDDWLYRDFNPNSEKPFPRDLIDPVIRQARRPFLRILNSDVYEKWWQHYTDPARRNEDARQVVQGVNPTVLVDRHLAEQGGRSPIATWNALAAPSRGAHYRDFHEVIASLLPPNCEISESPHPYRVIMLQEWHRWPLSGVREITVPPHGLCSANCNDFPSFHTRKDVAWTPLTENEIKMVTRLQRLLAVGILCEIVKPLGGFLNLGRVALDGKEDPWQFPLSVRSAAHMIVTTGRDANQNSLSFNQAEQILEQRIAQKRQQIGDDVKFVEFLLDRMRQRFGSEVSDLSPKLCEDAVVHLCTSLDDSLKMALMKVKPIQEEIKNSLWRRANDPRPRGGHYEKPGFYCSICGGLIGETEEEALRNGWRCYVNPDHCFYSL